jgi:hypothetical protein
MTQNKKGGNSNLIDCNAIAQNIKGRQLQFNRLQCNLAKYEREVTNKHKNIRHNEEKQTQKHKIQRRQKHKNIRHNEDKNTKT